MDNAKDPCNRKIITGALIRESRGNFGTRPENILGARIFENVASNVNKLGFSFYICANKCITFTIIFVT